MPDHLHLLLEGSDDSELRATLKLARQRTALAFTREWNGRLWQEGYFERVLRESDDPKDVIDYILNNPVRAGLVNEWHEYGFSWAVGCRD